MNLDYACGVLHVIANQQIVSQKKNLIQCVCALRYDFLRLSESAILELSAYDFALGRPLICDKEKVVVLVADECTHCLADWNFVPQLGRRILQILDGETVF